jgi:putative Ca2+/H+ antiporter (TMEM165/GDT1 family)
MELINIFIAVFIAELGDKTQIATVAFATNRELHPLQVFAASAGALVLSTAIAIFIGRLAGQYLQSLPLKPIAGTIFIVIGLWYYVDHFRNGAVG